MTNALAPLPHRLLVRARGFALLALGVATTLGLLACKTDAECRRGCLCASRGECSASGRSCVAGTDADCRASRVCREIGACSAKGDRCVALRVEDCRASHACRAFGRCEAVDGQCRDGARSPR